MEPRASHSMLALTAMEICLKNHKDNQWRKRWKEAGAGRKPGSINKITALKNALPEIKEIKGTTAQKAVTAAAALGCVDEMAVWFSLLSSKDEHIKFKTLTYLVDQRDGKARQRVETMGENGGPIVVEDYPRQADSEVGRPQLSGRGGLCRPLGKVTTVVPVTSPVLRDWLYTGAGLSEQRA